VHNRPAHLTDDVVLATVREHFDTEVVAVEHVPVGFGAWHWRADTAEGPALFLSLDPPTPRHGPGTLQATYAAAAALDLPFVHAPVPTTSGRYTVALGADLLSATTWLPGRRPDTFGEDAADLVRRLHAAPPPPGLRAWTPLVRADLASRLAETTSTPWHAGPFGEDARLAIREQLPAIAAWTHDYVDLCAGLDRSAYVATHGEPHVHNQWLTDDGLRLIDWESLILAPPERDLIGDGVADQVDHDPDRRRLFDLEWRLAEIEAYAEWLRAEHDDTEDVRTALGGLRHELSRP
jgi:spectinomycin phosphotransferase